ncbi:relaxase/mobilization nuclease RlxS [Oceanibaculum pacificum]|uniref:Conjugal transfer protein TraI n=1 Tax=Oceanibaculum pacificum TaxID=580166 RepID=A0A154W1J7_9PROT|nr:relaxase/mobilization nuclease RlxS [Oceanibaculum pacificum]KZD07359.1 conjugal transfer protein TraI [Oceanibaculum pacificum]
MKDDDDFTPRLGRIRARGSKRGRRYLHQVLRSVAFAGGRPSAGRGTFQGNRIGRGAGVGRVLASRDRYAAYRARRVIVKSRIVKLQGQGRKAAQLHLRYIQRDGVTREGLPGDLYDAESDRADGRAFLERGEGDRHQFRFIVSAEDAAEYDELKGFTRRLMRQMEEDLGTRLDWVAVDHFNTGHPHTHIVLLGRDDQGKDLVIARDYLARGMRERAAEIVGLDLGPRSDLEIEHRLRREVEQERFTSLDRGLLREVGDDGLVGSSTVDGDAFRQTLRVGRLQKLRRLGLAEEVGPGRWRLAEDLEPVLRRMGERGDIIKTMHREMVREGRDRATADYAIYDPADPKARRLVGRVVARGLSDEIDDHHYLIADGVDGRAHYIDIGRADATDPLPDGAIVAIEPMRAAPRDVDRTIAEIADANDGRYSVDIHLRHDPTATVTFAETHVRRLEAMRRRGMGVERQLDGTWMIAPDHLDRAAAYERSRAQASPVIVEMLSAVSLDRQVGAAGATWLDRELLADTPTTLRDAGFGREVRQALDRRRQWLVEQELARQEHDRIVYRANMLGILRRRELTRVADQLSGELGLQYAESELGQRIEGVYRRRLDLASGRFAVIEKAREFTLVPWRPVLERNLGKRVFGVARGDAISWSLGRKRNGPGLS